MVRAITTEILLRIENLTLGSSKKYSACCYALVKGKQSAYPPLIAASKIIQ